MMTEKPNELLPLAITQFGENVCVAGTDLLHRWTRPAPITPAQIASDNPDFLYDHLTLLTLGARPDDGQAEDRSLLRVVARPTPVDPQRRLEAIRAVCAEDVATALADEHSIGLVRASVLQLVARRHTGGRHFLHIEFRDAGGAKHDWVCPELGLNRLWGGGDGEASMIRLERAVKKLADFEITLAVALGDRNDRFPGQYRGRHPLCVGLHAIETPTKELHELL